MHYMGAHHSLARARAQLKYIILALSGHMDDVMAKYKVVDLQLFSSPRITLKPMVLSFPCFAKILESLGEVACVLMAGGSLD